MKKDPGSSSACLKTSVLFFLVLWFIFGIIFYRYELLLHPSLQYVYRRPYSKTWQSPRFPSCRMDACFNFSRCQNMKELLVHHYGAPFQPTKFFTALESSPWYTPNPEDACILMLSEPEDFDFFKPHPRILPSWNGGQNHVIVTFADRWLSPHPPTIGMASILSSELRETTYRPGFDISIPLPGQKHFTQIQRWQPFDRKYFLTFKGVRYLGETEGNFRSDSSFKGLHNGKDVIVAVSCDHPTNNKIRKLPSTRFAEGCDEDEEIYQKYDFADLMNSTFCLTPGGRSPASYRLIEALSAGAIPILICDDYVKPFDSLIQWHQCLLQFSTTQMHRILPTLRALTKEQVERRQSYCLFIYQEYLKDDETLLRSTITALKLRFYGVFSEFSQSLNSTSSCWSKSLSLNISQAMDSGTSSCWSNNKTGR